MQGSNDGRISTHMSDSFHPRDLGVIVRNTQPDDISKIVDLQKESYPYLALMEIFGVQKSQKVIFAFFRKDSLLLLNQMAFIVGSASTFIVSLNPQYAEHTWKDITADGSFTTIIQAETVCILQIYPLIQNTDMKVSEA